MFYEIGNELKEIRLQDIGRDRLTVGFVKSEELPGIAGELGFDEETVAASQRANPLFRTGVDVHQHYTFAELRIVNRDGSEDSVSLYIGENLLVIVDIFDEDGSTTGSFFRALKKYPGSRVNEERMVFCLFESLLSDGNGITEEIRNRLTEMEESIVDGNAGERFNVDLLALKKRILKYSNFYGQIQDITEVLEENDNEILNEDNLIYISNLSGKVTRLRDDMNVLSNVADHIQDAYATLLDQRLNRTMKIFTIITTIFFPLTIIVGWYGMNFTAMPELTWRYGYLYVILLSAAVIALLVLVGKRKKWF